ncbi:hypothetical protein CFC21_054389 [Triticum aestivum]|uniref:BTB domain-containing protein n=2 Tax=Triticum aestivum TaxID=4565 RepID=A0A9R1GD34_WHEAT|nr:BTB/POZ domain-containing protein POB1-like isoform X1 [Triticum aestivum]KAF7045267.1 hypothetical protein CFC21_054389 [Triticum aestivum]
MAGGEETAAAAEAEMDLEFSRGADVPSFEFAFNSEKFSDKVLQVEVVAGDDGGGGPLPDSVRHIKGQAMSGTQILTVKALHINSAILAARSPFFLKLFSNGMKESDQMRPRIRIANSEQIALMEVLSYMYSGKLTTAEPTLLLDILMVADKFEVISCMRRCSQLLTNLPMTTESALLCIDHPCSTSLAAEVQHVISVAKEFLADKYKDFDKFRRELVNISLAGMEAIFSSTDMHVSCEDDLYYFMLEWVRARYLDSEERRGILSSRLLPLVRFSHMTCTTLEKILACTDNDIDHEQVTKRITEVLLHKAYPRQMENALSTQTGWQFAERAYKYKPVKLVAFDRPCPQVTVYLDLTREECSRLFRSEHICSHPFQLGGRDFYLVAFCEMDEQSNLCTFGLCLVEWKNMKGSSDLTIDIEFAARTRLSGKFVSNLEVKVIFSLSDWVHGSVDLFGVPWSTFISDDNLFINGVLHLRADLRLAVGQMGLQS